MLAPLLGFNEAAAVMPRKTRIARRARTAIGRFNEAAAVMPRKTFVWVKDRLGTGYWLQ